VKYKCGHTIDQIAFLIRIMKINVNTVSKWLKRYAIQGNVERKKRIGKKCTTTEQNNKILP